MTPDVVLSRVVNFHRREDYAVPRFEPKPAPSNH